MSPPWPWLSLALLGAYHGINPAMGWLFAVALGLQEQSRKALLRALLPIALGHWASIAHARSGGEVVAGLGTSSDSIAQSAAAVLVHTLAMLLVMSVVAIAVYEKLGLALLRRAWVNLDALWAVAIIAAGILTLFT